jgi:hypothetical protein
MLSEPVTKELTEQLCVRPSRERRWPRDNHMILCSTFKTGYSLNFLFEFQVVWTSNRSKFKGPLHSCFGELLHTPICVRAHTHTHTYTYKQKHTATQSFSRLSFRGNAQPEMLYKCKSCGVIDVWNSRLVWMKAMVI